MIKQAVMARGDVAKYLRGQAGESDANAHERIEAYLEELCTTQRYRFYRALQHPLYPILRKVKRIAEHVEYATQAMTRGRIVYVSNHKSHLDYLIEPLVLDDHGIRPPLTAAGINLFGGALGLLHRHVTGAIPIRRNSKDPLYLATLRAYVAEVLKRRDLLYYAEGGRSYSGELRSPKTGLLQAALLADRAELSIVPMAVSYDLVLEDRILSRQGVKRSQRPFSRELAEMVGAAVGYRTRAFVSFGAPVSLDGLDPHSRREGLELSRTIRERIGVLHKVLPTALVAQAMRPSATRRDMETRVAGLVEVLASRGANLGAVHSVKQAVEQGIELLILRSVIVPESQRYRVRDRTLLRYYARSIEHLLSASRQSGARPH